MIQLLRAGIWIAAAASGLAAADSGQVIASQCRRAFLSADGSGYVGRAEWQDTSGHGLVGATEERTAGQALLLCTVRLPAGTAGALLDFSGARVSFTGEQADSQANGLDVSVVPGKVTSYKPSDSICTLGALRTSRETWIELGAARYTLPLAESTDRVTLILRLVDLSRTGATRADIGIIRIRAALPGETVRECPPLGAAGSG